MFNSLSKLFSTNKTEKNTNKILKIAKKNGHNDVEIKMIQSILNFKSLNVRDVMIPRIDVYAINIQNKSDFDEILNNDSYSRIPIYDNEIDNILGILHTKHYYLEKIKKNKKNIDINKLISKPHFIPESKPLATLLSEMQSNHIHIAIVVDEYGGFSGIITLEDIIEEIIGDIQDEFDEEKEDCIKIDDHTYSIDARLSLEEIPKEIILKDNHNEIETIGGYILSELGYIPKLHQNLIINNIKFQITEKKRNSILRIKVSLENRN